MKKVFFTAGFILTSSMLFAQSVENLNPVKEQPYSEILTSLKPNDESPVVFPTQEELDEKQFDKIEKIKQLIIDNHENKETVERLRKELWRFENAIVITIKN